MQAPVNKQLTAFNTSPFAPKRSLIFHLFTSITMKKYLFLSILIALLSLGGLQAQRYTTAIGLRAGYGLGISYKSYIKPKVVFEGILSVRWRGMGLTGLVQRHRSIPGVPGMQWYYGGGVHAGYWNDITTERPLFSGQSSVILGLDGVIGIEYTFAEIPINVSLDWIPMVNILGSNVAGNIVGGGGFAIRYAF